MKFIMSFLVWLIPVISYFSYIACYLFHTYYLDERERGNEQYRQACDQKLNLIEMIFNRIRLASGLCSILLIGFWTVQILLHTQSVFAQSIPDEDIEIVSFPEDEDAEISRMFSREISSSKPKEEPETDSADPLFSHLRGKPLKQYRREFAGLYLSNKGISNMSFSQLPEEQSAAVRAYSEEIEKLQEGKKNRKLTEEESVREYQLYTSINGICRAAENVFQAARAAEDVFWAHHSSLVCDYHVLLEYASYSIGGFQLFYAHENHMVGGEEKREVMPEELYYRNGKVYNTLSDHGQNIEDEDHFMKCAYCCFRNVTVEGSAPNEWSLLGYCYLCETILHMLSLLDYTVPSEDYNALLEEARTAYENASNIYDRRESVTSSVLRTEEGELYKVEDQIGTRLDDIRKELNRYEDPRLAQSTNLAAQP